MRKTAKNIHGKQYRMLLRVVHDNRSERPRHKMCKGHMLEHGLHEVRSVAYRVKREYITHVRELHDTQEHVKVTDARTSIAVDWLQAPTVWHPYSRSMHVLA